MAEDKKDLGKLALLKEMLAGAEKSIRSAANILNEFLGDTSSNELLQSRLKTVSAPQINSSGARVVEGVFDGEKMVVADGKNFPVPANYASKSKLVEGDQLKLTINDDGRFVFKQIGPIERKHLVGPLTFEDGQYKVLAGGKAYKVLLASVTFFRAEVGDEITVLVPENLEATWGAIEAVLPKIEKTENSATEKSDEKLSTNDDDFDF